MKWKDICKISMIRAVLTRHQTLCSTVSVKLQFDVGGVYSWLIIQSFGNECENIECYDTCPILSGDISLETYCQFFTRVDL